jgi:AraC-like DNA-binding protein
MLGFYKKAILMFSGLLALTFVLAIVCWNRVFVRIALMPPSDSVIPWKLETITDAYRGGGSSITVNDSSLGLDYDYILTQQVEYPQATAVFAFAELKSAKHLVDLSRYSTVSFRVACQPRNVLTFHLHSFDPKITDPANFYSYRIAETFFSCDEGGAEVEIDLRYLSVATWWLGRFKREISDQGYRLDKVAAFSIVASPRGPVNTPAKVKISKLAFHEYDWRYAWIFAGLCLAIWACFIFRLFKLYRHSLIADMKDKLQKDRPLIAHQQLSIEPRQDREKALLLRFIATEYANPDLSLEMTITALGINRTKINELLKQELELTFTSYLNKLRLTEAARLLSEKENANVAEIAYSVGYNNVTYFNKLFKNEYGCTPKTFKNIYKSSEHGLDED